MDGRLLWLHPQCQRFTIYVIATWVGKPNMLLRSPVKDTQQQQTGMKYM